MSDQNSLIPISVFNNEEFGSVRVIGDYDNPLFCLSDVCKILELGNPSQVKTRLDDGVISNEIISDSLGRKQTVTFVNEDGLYDVILDSRKPNAKRFRKWITSEVIPSIRKTGSYSVKQQEQPTMSSLEILRHQVNVMTDHENRLNAIEKKNDITASNISSLTDKSENHEERIGELEHDLKMEQMIASEYDVMLDVKTAQINERLYTVEETIPDIQQSLKQAHVHLQNAEDKISDIMTMPSTVGPDFRTCIHLMVGNLIKYKDMPSKQAYLTASEDLCADISVLSGHMKNYISSQRKRRRKTLISQGVAESTVNKKITAITIIDADPSLKTAAVNVFRIYQKVAAEGGECSPW